MSKKRARSKTVEEQVDDEHEEDEFVSLRLPHPLGIQPSGNLFTSDKPSTSHGTHHYIHMYIPTQPSSPTFSLFLSLSLSFSLFAQTFVPPGSVPLRVSKTQLSFGSYRT